MEASADLQEVITGAGRPAHTPFPSHVSFHPPVLIVGHSRTNKGHGESARVLRRLTCTLTDRKSLEYTQERAGEAPLSKAHVSTGFFSLE